MGGSEPTVAQIHRTYLNLTENWIYHQVRFLRDVRSIFLAKRPANLHLFPWDEVFLLWQQPLLRRQVERLVFAVLGFFPYYREVCRTEGVDLLHAHSGAIGREMLPLAESLGVPLVTSFYGYEMTVHSEGLEGLRRAYRRLFDRGAAFVAEGPHAREQLLRLGCPPDRAHVHRLGIDPDEIPFVERRPAPDGPLRVLAAARFDEKKGLPYAVEAVCRVIRRGIPLELTVVGDAGTAPVQQRIKAELHRLVHHYGVDERVRFTGFLPTEQLRSLAEQHHIFLHPSVHARNGDSEGGHPVVLTEAAAAGMPIIATRHCDIPEVVVHGETGWLCSEKSVEELEAALEEAWEERFSLGRIGRAARRLVEARYDGRRNTLDPIYADVLARGR